MNRDNFTEEDARHERRQEHLMSIDRDNHGVGLCPNCGTETTTVICCRCGSGFTGCPDCMKYVEGHNEYFCGDSCDILEKEKRRA